MTPERVLARQVALIDGFRAAPSEISWAEFKVDNTDPQMIGELISAVANSAAYSEEAFGFVIWGVRDDDHVVVGTRFTPQDARASSQPLELWLSNALSPSIHFQFDEVVHPDGRLVLLTVARATSSPVKFRGVAYIRVGEAKVELSRFPDRERTLWDRLRPSAWESNIAEGFLTDSEVVQLLDTESYFNLLEIPLPSDVPRRLEALEADGLVTRDVGGRWSIRNSAAVLFANDLAGFSHLQRKAVRVIEHQGADRIESRRERPGTTKGYAAGFTELRDYLKARLPENEHVQEALRREVSVYPDVAVREVVANALIHQDLSIRGTGPVIEIFEDRLEVSNPGAPLVSPERMIDFPPRSRNEKIASLMRRMRICDERGAGVDRIVNSAEVFQLPPPDFQSVGENMRVTLYAPRGFNSMSAAERVRACYQHAVLRYLVSDPMTNATLRQRLGVASQNAAQISRIIREALAANRIKPADPASPRAGYVPYWVGNPS